jgi:hypothetical protein
MQRFARPISTGMLTLALLLAGPAGHAATPPAGPACYTDSEFEAELALRLHTEIMVTSLSCESGQKGQSSSLFAQYRKFTEQNQQQIIGWERAMIGHFKRVGKGNATRSFDSYRTRLANELSQRVSSLSPIVYCPSHMPLVPKMAALTPADVRKEAFEGASFRLTDKPRCQTRTAGARNVEPTVAKPAKAKPAKAKSPAATPTGAAATGTP